MASGLTPTGRYGQPIRSVFIHANASTNIERVITGKETRPLSWSAIRDGGGVPVSRVLNGTERSETTTRKQGPGAVVG